MKIITLTLNPAFDIHCFVKDFAPYHENLAKIEANEAGGKGVNISRALTVNGVENLALVVLGDENGDSFAKRLTDDGMSYLSLTVKGRIRENITLHTNDADETRISFEGFDTDETILCDVLKKLEGEELDGSIITFTGRVPSGISMGAVKDFLGTLKKKGAKIVIDSRSFTLDDIVDVAPWLIKPNQEEISVYLGQEINGFEDALGGAKALHEKGIENVMISLGSKGALLVSGEGCFVAQPPKIEALSTIGAGDSSIGGFLAAAKSGAGADGMLRLAVSYGTAACMTEGTRPPLPNDVKSVYEKVTVKKI
ncbi:MAG: 1-phosphofructokinase family hexose kinase [Ruminococcaceae bacterium]|nr:1-phosphofructokinase family hexose kinase [Oscillospiraceae bacterium]